MNTLVSRVAFSSAWIFSTVLSTQATAALIAHWDFNSTDGLNDVAGLHHPVGSAGVEAAPDRFSTPGGARQFTGDTWGQGQTPCCPTGDASYLEISNAAALSPPTFSLSFWPLIEPGTFQEDTHMHIVDYQQVGAGGDEGWGVALVVRTGDDSIAFGIGDDQLSATQEITDGVWHEFQAQYDRVNDVASMFLDGALVAFQGNIGGYTPAPTDALVIANVSHSLFRLNHNYVGLLDDIQIHDQLLVPGSSGLPMISAVLAMAWLIATSGRVHARPGRGVTRRR